MNYRMRRKMKFWAAVLPVVGIAMVVLPGVAGQNNPVAGRLAAMQAQLGIAIDPNPAATLTITLPKGFTTLDVSTDPFAN
jgi:drug/metabolite transporter (DMT)-like permease